MPPKIESSKHSGKGIFGFFKHKEHKEDSTSSVDRNPSPQTPSDSTEHKFDKKKALGIAGMVVDTLGNISEVSSFLGPLKIVCDGLKFAIDTTNTIIDNDDTRNGLVESLSEQQRFIVDHTAQLTDPRFQLSDGATNGLVGALKDYASKIDALSEKLDTLRHDKKGRARGVATKIFLANADRDELGECTGSLEASFRRFMDSVIFFIADQTRFIAEQNAEIMARQALSQLKYVDGAQGSQHSHCLEGTRQEVLKNITQWAADSTSKPMYCLADLAGTGKSTISAQMTYQWMQDRLLLAQYFFSRPQAITSGKDVPTTIAKDMAAYSPTLRSLIVKAVDSDPNLSGSSIDKKLDLLVLAPLKDWKEERVKMAETVQKEVMEKGHMRDQVMEPWQKEMQDLPAIKKLWMEFNETKKTMEDAAEDESKSKKIEEAYVAYLKALEHALMTPPFIVIDALDECVDVDRIKILQCFVQFLNNCSSDKAPFKLFLTCRPEEDVNSIIKDPKYSQLIERPPFALQSKDTASNHEDIELYAKSRLGMKLDPPRISIFVEKAGNLFIWASTAAEFILRATVAKKRFDELMASTLKNKELDTLYGTVLSAAIERAESDEEELLRKVLEAICVAREPLTVEAMDELLDMPEGDGESVSGEFVKRLGSVLSDGSAGKPVQVLHATFIDYVLQRRSADQVGFSRENAEATLANGCLAALLSDKLKEDICGIRQGTESLAINAEIVDLQQRIQKNTTPGLRYAAVHGLSHATSSLQDAGLVEKLLELFKEKLLCWIELMSFLKEIYSLITSVYSLKTRIEEIKDGRTLLMTELRDWCEEIIKIIQPFQATIEESASQIYTSALPFSPSLGNVSRHYHQSHNKFIPTVLRGALSVQSQSEVLAGHTSSIQYLCFSPNGRQIATASDDLTVRLWDTATGAVVGIPFVGHTQPILGLSFSSNGKYIVTASVDSTIRLWDAAIGAAIGTPLVCHTSSISCLSFSPDGQKIAAGSEDCIVRLWDASTGEAIGIPLVGHTSTIECLSFSPDGRKIATGSVDNTVRLWDASTGEAIGTTLAGHTSTISCLSFSPDGRQIATGSVDNTARLWNAVTGSGIGTPLVGHTNPIQCLSFSPNGQQIATGSYDNTVRLWDAASGAAIRTPLEGHAGYIRCLSFSPDGRQIATGSGDSTVRLWDAATSTAIGTPLVGHAGTIFCLSFSSDGQQIATGAGDGTARLWDVAASSAIGILPAGHTSTISCLSFSRDGRKFATGSGDNTARLWDASTGSAIGTPLVGHTGNIYCLSFSPDGQQIATGSEDSTVRLWDAATGSAIRIPLMGHTNYVNCLSFSSDGRQIATGSGDSTVQRWDAASGAAIGTPLVGHTAVICCIYFSPNGQQIATGSYDNTVRLWDAAAGSAIGTLLVGHTTVISCLSFSPDGRQIATGLEDNTVRLWDAATNDPIGDPIQSEGHPWSVQLQTHDNTLFLFVNGKEIYNLSLGSPNDHSTTSQSTRPQTLDNGGLDKCEYKDGWTYVHLQTPLRFRLPSSFIYAGHCIREGKIAYGGWDGSVITVDCTHLL